MANPFDINYKAPTPNSNYLKIQHDEPCVIRIITPKEEVITYFAEFVANSETGKKDKKTYKDNGDGITPKGVNPDPKENPRLTWAVVVIDIETEELKIWEIAQKGVRDELFAIANGKLKNDWTKFDIQVTKTGKGFETKHNFQNGDTKELSQDLQTFVDKELPKINLKALEQGNDPFESSNEEEEAKKKE